MVNLKSLEDRFADGDAVTAESLAKIGLIRDTKKPVKVLGEGELTKKLDVTAARLSKSAEAKIKAAGGNVTVVEKKKWTRSAGKPAKAAKPAPDPHPETESGSSEE